MELNGVWTSQSPVGQIVLRAPLPMELADSARVDLSEPFFDLFGPRLRYLDLAVAT
jgi:hypothetical protein